MEKHGDRTWEEEVLRLESSSPSTSSPSTENNHKLEHVEIHTLHSKY